LVWNGMTYQEEGDYTHTLSSVHGCDSIVTLHLHHYPQYESDIYDTILIGQQYVFDGVTYSQPGTYTRMYSTIHGCDSLMMLNLETNDVNITAVQGNVFCADEGTAEIMLTYTGTAHEAQVLFNTEAKEAGWRDTIMPMPSDGIITIPVHSKAGVYDCQIVLLFRGQTASTTGCTITMLYPSSVIEQAWNDVLAVLTHDYNGGYDFVAFKWYENGVLIEGENKSYLYKPLLMGAEYTALLTEANGTSMMTCPLIATPQTDITLYPTIVTSPYRVHCYVQESADIQIYNTTGCLLLNETLISGDNLIEVPYANGVYTVKITLNNTNTTRTYKLIIR